MMALKVGGKELETLENLQKKRNFGGSSNDPAVVPRVVKILALYAGHAP